MVKEYGIPTTVSVYSPMEFLGLEKITLAFLDISLEKIKGGLRNQLLVGHLVKFIQINGLDSIKQLPRFRSEYFEEIKTKCSQKGINLEGDLSVLNFEKIDVLSDGVSVYQPNDPLGEASNLYCSSNYSMFNYLEFNRKISWSHVNELRLSIVENGILSYPVMIYTNCVDGEWKYWIVDGQHRFEAFKKLGLPIYFTLYKKPTSSPITLYDLVRLISCLNNTSRRWGIHQYLRAWKSIKVEEYEVISSMHEKTHLSINTLLQAYSGKSRKRAIELFTAGEFKMYDRLNGEKYIEYLQSLGSLITRNTTVLSAFLDLFRQIDNYDNEKMKTQLVKVKNSWVFPDKKDEVLLDLKKIYEDSI